MPSWVSGFGFVLRIAHQAEASRRTYVVYSTQRREGAIPFVHWHTIFTVLLKKCHAHIEKHRKNMAV
jgi:hypothetical protein